MPRFRFNWEHIDGDLAGHLAASLKLAGPPADALRSRFGARPKEDFIGETWAVLMDKWLAVDE
ncbi:MAG: polymerase-associated protein RapA, partial [Actinomycetota bacterium]